MNSEFDLQYHSLNVIHLEDDELDHELALRAVEFSSGESRDIKRRKLRNVMKAERETNNFMMRPVEESAREAELQKINEKLVLIRESLESKKVKKTEYSQLQTRLIHLYYRLLRLRKVYNTNGLEQIALGLLNNYFSLLSKDPLARAKFSERLQNDLSRLSAQVAGNELNNSDSDQEEEEQASDHGHEDQEIEDLEDSDDLEQEVEEENNRVKDSRNSSTPIRKTPKGFDAEELYDRIIQHVDQVLSAKLKTLKIGDSSGQDRKPGMIRGEKKKVVGKPKPKIETRMEVKEQVREEIKLRAKAKRRSRSEAESSAKDSESDSESMASSRSADESEAGGRLKRRPRPVCDWKLKYDGRDEGRSLNKFVSEVEFMAEAENISKRSLFNEAIHLFSGDARAWYIEGRRNKEFRNWTELVTELKLEYQPPDMDFHYEQQAASRRQKRGEKFQDYYLAIKQIFDQMAIPPTDQRKFDIVFRNLRSDYKNSLLVKGVRTLRTLKVWGRKLDSANWFLYRKTDGEQGSRTTQVHEINARPSHRDQRQPSTDWKDKKSWTKPEGKRQNSEGFKGSSYDNRGPKKAASEGWKGEQSKSKQNPPVQEPQEGNSRISMEQRIAAYRIPDRTVCFNCRGKYHHYNTCLREKDVFCTTCGFHDFVAENCPFCAKNGKRSM